MKNKIYCLFIISIMFFLANAQYGHCYKISKTSTGAWIQWSSNSALYYVNVTDAPGGFLASSLNAMDTWSAAGSKFSFEYGGLTSSDFDSGMDGYNTISYGLLDPNQFKDTLGLNLKWFYVSSGDIIEADIILNSNFTWGGSSGHDVESVILHELGHSLSLDDLYDPSYSNRVMYGYGAEGEIKRTLHQGDINGIVALYGSAPVTKYSVSVSANPSAGGTVSGGGTYNSGTSVTVSATANTGYEFLNWTEDGVVVSSNTSDRGVKGNYEQQSAQYVEGWLGNWDVVMKDGSEVTWNIDETWQSGTGMSHLAYGIKDLGNVEFMIYFSTMVNGHMYIEMEHTQDIYDLPQDLTQYTELLPNPSPPAEFTSFTAEDGIYPIDYGFKGSNSPSANYTFTIYSNRMLVANFEISQYTVSVSANPTIGGSVTGGGTYNQGDSVTVTATANTGYEFLNWTESGDVVSNQESYTFTVNSDRILVSNFEISQYTLKYTAGENGSITGDTSQTVKHGSNGTSVRAVPDTGYHFTKWSDGSTDNPRTDTDVTRDIDVTAHFEINKYTITLYPNPEEGGTVVNAGVYETGKQLTVVGIPNDEYTFINWTENGDELSTKMDYTFTVTSDRILIANFEESGLCAAAYILNDDPRLEILRQFRDKTLSTSDTGIKIISLYYDKSDYIIEICEKNPSAKHIFKIIFGTLIPVLEVLM